MNDTSHTIEKVSETSYIIGIDFELIARATQLFNKWVSQCTVSNLSPLEQGALLIQMIAEVLEEERKGRPGNSLASISEELGGD